MDKKQADEFLKTLVSGYVWVASADQAADVLEMHKYEHVMVQSQFATQFDPDDIRRYFKDMVTLFEDNYDAAVEITKERLREVASHEHLVEEVIRVARAAVVGDGKIEDSEELVLKEIAALLNIQSEL